MPPVGRPILHVRVDDELLRRVDALAEQLKVDRSVVIRSLLGAALGDDGAVILARETVMMLSQQRKLLLARFNAAVQEVIAEHAETGTFSMGDDA